MANHVRFNPLVFICLFFFAFHSITCTNFSFSSFSPNDHNITLNGTAVVANVFNHNSIRLNDNQVAGNVFNSSGRAHYSQPIQLWDSITNSTTDFTTYFEFSITFFSGNSNLSSGGIAFFLASENSLSTIPSNSFAGWLGLFNETTDADPSNQMVAVEFDTFQDEWDPSNNHVGINVNSIISKANSTWSNTMVSGDTLGARISYNGTTKNLSVHLKDPQVPVDAGSLNLSYNVDLTGVLPERVFVGFSGSTGRAIPVQVIRSWNFTSTLDLVLPRAEDDEGDSKIWLVGLVVSILGVGIVLGVLWRNRRMRMEDYQQENDMDLDDSMDEEFEKGTGPKRFSCKELVSATNNFSEEGKLGQGGFGGVYKGFSNELNMAIAVKKISRGSKQGKKEYMSEVKIISRLRHRNLVQLVGWSHERGEFLLVYEYMPNGSLDSHLFHKKSTLTWAQRHKISLGLASALLYLHEEWEKCVVHRDIKSSNVMLDSSFNAKLGDFGLARLVDHELGSQTTVLAGTMGYMAPECLITGKASKESDVFSFGVVALEIACGRKPVEQKAEEANKVRLVEWVWEFYGRGRILEAVDEALCGEFEEMEAECLMIVGLWCVHPDHSLRPSIKQAIHVLNFEAPLPDLPCKMPVPTYLTPSPMLSDQYSFTWSNHQTRQTAAGASMATNSLSIV
ncbi:PREDICTED: L-type lectin-domain containing receptor kinase IX.1-like [Nelumbo nucifera]|uniref:non-specific serine/threonine protein kinase n=2 Tax=Nelumbo nucifera TaxID=4432 RepID=A0A1U8A225_NELNU|nr:PREDICTED: L-type lectin-domain containing receptor kinase IX.1-like [Nelumbo nucifera]DAD40885.1 TPA_asm: hypothetical protein HUJ06_015208 [Nelumbo nucifera]